MMLPLEQTNSAPSFIQSYCSCLQCSNILEFYYDDVPTEIIQRTVIVWVIYSVEIVLLMNVHLVVYWQRFLVSHQFSWLTHDLVSVKFMRSQIQTPFRDFLWLSRWHQEKKDFSEISLDPSLFFSYLDECLWRKTLAWHFVAAHPQ